MKEKTEQQLRELVQVIEEAHDARAQGRRGRDVSVPIGHPRDGDASPATVELEAATVRAVKEGAERPLVVVLSPRGVLSHFVQAGAERTLCGRPCDWWMTDPGTQTCGCLVCTRRARRGAKPLPKR